LTFCLFLFIQISKREKNKPKNKPGEQNITPA